MNRRSTNGWRQTLGLAVLMVPALAVIGWTCNVPVFRYAIEHWRPDPYRLTIVHRGPLGDEPRSVVAKIEDRAATSHLNVAIRTVDRSALSDDAERALVALLPDALGPQYLMQYPAGLRIDTPVGTGSFSADELTRWSDSPLRRELVKRLAEGQTAVWVLVTTGDAALDEPAAMLLDEELPRLTRRLKLPELTESPEDVLLGSTPLKISFSQITVQRDDPAEQALVAMLLGCESDLGTTNEPMVFPVFGRCRVLLPLIGAGISPDNLHTSAAFLTGACSCQVKNQNPGFDLLHTANWAAELVLDHDPAVALSESMSSREPVLIQIPEGTSSPATATATLPPAVPPPPLTTGAMPVTGIALIVAAVAAVAFAICWRR
jgi:hypothetical protein